MTIIGPLLISSDNGYKLYSKRDTNFCFVKNYNPVILKTWLMNIDLQPVYNYHRTLSYMTVYFSKSENSKSEAMKQIVQNIKQNLLTKEAKKNPACFHLFKTNINTEG